MIYTVPGLARVTVLAAVGTVPGRTAEVEASFIEPREIAGVLVLPASGSAAGLAGLALQILDNDGHPIFTDMAGDERNDRLPFAMNCLALAGRGVSPFPLQRLVAPGERWLFTLFNLTGADIDVASVSLHLADRA